MKLAILTRREYRSPRVLAESLKAKLEILGVHVEIFYDIEMLNRMVSFKNSKINFHFWVKKKILNGVKDILLLKKIKKFDAVIISECIPNGFIKQLYNIEAFKKKTNKPVLLYEVYYLGNAPSQILNLKKENNATIDRYNYHLSVSEVTEIKQPTTENWYPIGIFGKSWNLHPVPKMEIIALIDFVHPGNEEYRKTQIRVLNKVGIKYIALDKNYSFEEIRTIYQQCSLYFMQSSEAFGLPVLECLCCGCQIFTLTSVWPMSWRLDENPIFHGEGRLPECFTVYNNEEILEKKLIEFKSEFNSITTPKKIFESFVKNYPSFYNCNENELERLLANLKKHQN